MQIQATTAGDAVQSGDQYLTFMLGGEEYGIEILDVQEIKNWGPITPLPRSEKHMLGVINLRGAIVPVLDLRVRFGLPDPSYDSTTSVVIVRCNGSSGPRIVGLVVDCVSEVYHLDPGDIQERSCSMTGAAEPTKIALPASFTEKTVDGVLETVKECTAAGLNFTIDGSDVERVDSAALQTLVLCLMSANGEALDTVEFVASDLLATACQTAGVMRAHAT